MPNLGALATYVLNALLPGALGAVENDQAVVLQSSSDGLTAHAGGGQASGLLIVSVNSRFSTVATIGDSALLPPSLVGMEVTILNGAANSMNIFPSAADNSGVGGTINAGAANAAYALPGGNQATFICTTAGKWYASKVAIA